MSSVFELCLVKYGKFGFVGLFQIKTLQNLTNFMVCSTIFGLIFGKKNDKNTLKKYISKPLKKFISISNGLYHKKKIAFSVLSEIYEKIDCFCNLI